MELGQKLRELSRVDAGDLPLISIYLDLRPQATGENPGLRSGLVVLKDRLREIGKTYWPRGASLDSFESDREKIDSFVDIELSPSSSGVAIFACSGIDLFEVIETGVEMENQVTVGPRPDLYQLARLLDDHETFIVALVDTNTARLFVSRRGTFTEVEGLDEDSVSFRKRATGGWSQARYQRHIDKHRKNFADEVATQLVDLDREVNAKHIVLAGDEVAITPLQGQLPATLLEKVRTVLRVHIRTPRDEVEAIVGPVARQLEADDAATLVEQLVSALRGSGLASMGLDEVRTALRNGQVDVLLIDDASTIDPEDRASLVAQAAATGATIEIVNRDDQLLQLGGVGALLRYRVASA
jgi:peptide chain release factor subunit 1